MSYTNKNYVLPRCKIAKFSIVMLEIARGKRATMKGFLLKSLKNNSEQVHFYQHCRPANCALTKK